MLPLLLALGGGLAGISSANQKNKSRQAQNEAEIAKTRMSAWSGLGGGNVDTQYNDPLTAAFSGGVGGLAAAQGLGAFGSGGASTPVVSESGGASYLGQNALGGADYANQMNQSAWNFGGPNQVAMMGNQRMPMSPYQF